MALRIFSWAIAFPVVAGVAEVLGFAGLAGTATGIAKLLFFVFVFLLVLTFVMGKIRGRSVS